TRSPAVSTFPYTTLFRSSYITKPFDPNELIAHVEAVLRRTGQFCQKVVYNGLCIMPRKGEVLLYDQDVTLTKYEFNLLYYLMQRSEEHTSELQSRFDLVC